MAFDARLKPFVINTSDIRFLIDQIDFRPLFDASGNIIVAWDGTGPVFDRRGVAYADQGSAQANLAMWGQSYQNFTDLAGTRDVSGYWNNLTPVLSHYGQSGQIFPRMVTADYRGYLAQVTGDATTGPILVTSVTPDPTTTESTSVTLSDTTNTTVLPGQNLTKIVRELITSGTSVTTSVAQTLSTTVIDGHHLAPTQTTVVTDSVTTTTSFDFVRDQVTTTLTSPFGTQEATATSTVQTSPAQVATSTATGTATTLSGAELDGRYHHFTTAYALAHQDYAVTAALPGTGIEGNTTAADGTAINIKNVVDYTPRMISRAITTGDVVYDTWANHAADNPLGANGKPVHTANEIYYDPQTGEARVLEWGRLDTVKNGGEGQIDTQARLAASAGRDDHFIGGLNPGVSPSNGFFVLFGQFFDHGLDFIDKGQANASGGAVTIKIALGIDDPLYGMLGPDGQPVTEITINRAKVQTLDAKGSEYANHVSPFIDQSQTYGSDEQRTALLREWVSTDGGASFHAGMNLLDGHTLKTAWAKPDGTLTNATLPTLNELRTHLDATKRDALTWDDVANLRNRDAAGHVVAGTSGEALLLDMNPHFDRAHLLGGQGETGAEAQKVLDAIATLGQAGIRPGDTFGFNANGVLTLHLGSDLPTGPQSPPIPAGTDLTGASALVGWVNFADFSIMQTPPGVSAASVESVRNAVSDILLASVGDHYVAGDGRVNENFGLTSVHHVFHEEHNFQVQNLIDALHRQDVATDDATHAKLHEFQIDTGRTNAAGDFIRADGSIAWNEDKVFLGAKLIVEMEYQHAAVDQYARNVSPNIQEFVGYSPDKQPDVTLEYAQVAFRFGHSTLRETIDTIDPTGGITGKIMGYALHDAFLNPEKFGDLGPASIVLGMTHQQQNEVDEFVTPALNQGLLGQPLDLAAINIARGRDIGVPTLNDFREALGMVRYTSWNDFGQNMQHPSSLVNFIAAYAFDGAMDKAHAVLDLASHAFADDAAGAVLGTVLGWTGTVAELVTRAGAFLSGDASVGGAGTLGFNQIDTWIGGLAEVHQPGGLLGETFDKVFVTQIESLMDGDRFYYLYRLAGQQFGEEVANGQLKDIFERNTGLTHLNGNIFGYADQYVDLGARKEVLAAGQTESLTTGNEHKYGDLADVANGTMGIYSNGGVSNGHDGGLIAISGKTYIQDTRLSADNPMSADYHGGDNAYALNGYVNLDGTPNSGAESSEVIVGSKGDDLIYAQGGDDTVYGEGGNDVIYGGFGIDRLYGGTGSDTMYGGDNPDLMDGGAGDDFLYGESSGTDINGADQIIGGSGNDLLDGGTGIDKLSAGSGDDKIYGGQDTDPFTHGGDGNDLVDGGSGGDILYGDNGDDLVIGGADQDQLFGGDGDDILRPGDPTGALTIGSDEVLGGDGTDTNDKGFDLIDFSDNNARPKGVVFDLGNQANPNVTVNGSPTQVPSFQIDGAIGSVSDDTLTGSDPSDAGNGADASIAGQNWLIGGSGNDTLEGLGGNDIIIGGSVRLDALIGTDKGVRYDADGNAVRDAAGHVILTGQNSTYDHNNNNAGLTDAEQLMDARYQGASHRAGYADVLGSDGLIDAANALGGAQFDKHFTEMLRSAQFKDTVLGDGGTDGTADTAVFTGNLARYTIQVIDFTASNGVAMPALKITDNRTAADFLDANGNPLLDANGNPLTSDGTDLLVGVEYARFADQTISLKLQKPVLDLHAYDTTVATLADNFNASQWSNSNGTAAWTTAWSETGDFVANANQVTGGQIQLNAAGSGQLRLSDNGDGASIQRTVDLSGASGATLAFDYRLNSFDTGDKVVASISFDNGATWHEIRTFQGTGAGNNTNGQGTVSVDLTTIKATTETFGANAIVKVEAVTTVGGGTSANNGYVAIDNLRIDVTKTTADADPFPNFTTTFTENGAAVTIARNPTITDDGAIIHSAKVVLTNAQAGDTVNGHDIAGDNISIATDTSVPGRITLTLTGDDTLAHYQAQIAAITFANTSNNPSPVDRIIQVTVNDGLLDSNLATTTVHVVPVNDAPTARADSVVTNVGNGPNGIVVPDWALLANDTDPDGPNPLAITGVSGFNSLTATHGSAAGAVTILDSGTTLNAPNGGSFSYTVTDSGAAPNTATGTVTLRQQTGANLNGTTGADILVDGATGHTIAGGRGDDIVLAGDGADTITWTASGSVTQGSIFGIPFTTVNVATDGHDFIDGGAGTDSFVLTSTVTGNNAAAQANSEVAETFDVYTLAEAQGAGITGLRNVAGEIVITRNGAVAAELVNVEEITINTGAGTDTVRVHGNFAPTQLAYNTIHVNDADGGDTVDITALTSDHRIVLSTDAAGHIVGAVRPQDVVDHHGATALPAGGAVTDGSAPDASGPDDTGTGHDTAGGPPAAGPDETSQTGDALFGTAEADLLVGHGATATIMGLGGDDLILGTGGADVIQAGAGDDLVKAGAGDDAAFGGAGEDSLFGGAGNDLVAGEAGDDRLFGEAGDDVLEGGQGHDVVFAGGGDDRVLATVGDGDDLYFGEAGSDTIDYSAIGDAITVDLGNGIDHHGSVVSAGSGSDSIFGFENFIGGAGNDTIIANDQANVLDGGGGDNTFVFRSAADADGDTIKGFQPGDVIDLTGIDADASAEGRQSFVLFAGTNFTAAGQVIVSHETVAGQEQTLVQASTTGGPQADFRIVLEGHHDLTAANFHSVH